MGLDMYLYKKNYIWQGGWIKPEAKQEVVVKKGGEIDNSIKPERIKYVVEEVGYWRKANQIHRWFVDVVQEGNDNCGSYYVSRDTLEELLDICKQVRDDHSKAESLLPSASGFFFGGTEYDEWYFDSIDSTIKIIEECLEDENADDFEYSSSW
ncbi:MAG: hypothetical protein RL621_1820 [Bacteroidota bacterium]|jgi:hypothetical protein